MRAAPRSLFSLAWWAIALIRQNCALLVRPSNPPPSASFRHSDHRAETYAVHVLLRSPRRKLLCRDIGLSLRRRRLPRYRVCAEEWLSRLKLLSKWLSLIRNATFRHPVRSRTTWALQVSMWLLENKLPHRANVAIAESAHQLYES